MAFASLPPYAPIVRPTFYNFPEDENCFLENDDMLLGENLLVPAVVEPGKRARSVYLPSPCGWYDFWTGESYYGGQEILLPAPWDRPPLLAREGCAIPLNAAEQHFSKPADKRSFCIFPHRAKGEFTYECFEDDGESEGYRQGHYWIWRLKVTASPSELCVEIQREGEGYLKTGQVSLLFPRQETRRIDILSGSVMVDASGATPSGNFGGVSAGACLRIPYPQKVPVRPLGVQLNQSSQRDSSGDRTRDFANAFTARPKESGFCTGSNAPVSLGF